MQRPITAKIAALCTQHANGYCGDCTVALGSGGDVMRRIDQNWHGNAPLVAMRNAWRRVDWFTRGVSRSQMFNGMLATAGFALKLERLRSWPVLVKIDISPACNLHCTYCVHANPAADKTGTLTEQSFTNQQRMPLADFQRIVDQIEGHVAAVALYYVGDPLMHPDLPKFCAIAAKAGLNCHVSTNFSFRLSDQRLAALADSGLTHLTVCVDSMQQSRYELTRVGGNIKLVLANLERILQIRKELGSRKPILEVQFIKYQHNIDEVDSAAAWCRDAGVDQFTEYWGNLHNYADLDPKQNQTGDPLDGQLFPRCAWPWFAVQIKYNGDMIPCCYHRVSDQYRSNGDARIVGNVVSQGFFDVWNSLTYQRIRRLTANPRTPMPSDDLFCQDCSVIFNTTAVDRFITADNRRWDEEYLQGSDGTVIRR